MGTINIPNSFSPNTTISSSDINDNFSTISNAINGNLDANNLATGAVTTTKIADANVTTVKIADASITNAKMSAEVKPVTITSEVAFDFVASGCVWSGDAYASTRVASMTSGVVYIGGVRTTVTTVTSRTFTASKDTYIDVDNTGTITYTEVTNNNTSPALSAGRIRLGIIVTGATTIAAAGSVNQGQETIVLPIASSIPYAVTDSLGNLICSRDPNRRILGYRQAVASQGGIGTTAVQITSLTCPVIVPTGRKIKITVHHPCLTPATAFGTHETTIWDGVVTSGTQLQKVQQQLLSGDSTLWNTTATVMTTPASASKTYNAGGRNTATGGASTTITASSTAPTYIMVELV